MLSIAELLTAMVVKEASDLFITANAAPSVKIDGKIYPVAGKVLTKEDAKSLCYEIMTEEQRTDFEKTQESNFVIYPKKIGRFRVNVFRQQSSLGMVVRSIKTKIPSLQELRLPEVLKKLIMKKRGLLLFTGGTGTGKSTSMASLVAYRSRLAQDHIITIEDPVEYLHAHKKSIITQREVGVDTSSFDIALVNAMRQAPDVIQIGEIRTQKTMENAIIFAETGHLCIATLHANNVYQSIDRIFNFFAPEKQNQLSMDLSLNLVGIVSQRLIRKKDGPGRVPAIEVLINTPLVSNLIREYRIDELSEAIRKSKEHGMQNFDHALFDLYEDGLINYEDAMNNAGSQNDLRLAIKLNSRHAKEKAFEDVMGKMSIDDAEY